MMNYCPVCKSPLEWESSDQDCNGTEICIETTLSCDQCGLVVHETEIFFRGKIEATFEFKENV